MFSDEVGVRVISTTRHRVTTPIGALDSAQKRRVEAEILRPRRQTWPREARPQRNRPSWSSRRAPPASPWARTVHNFFKNLGIRHMASRIQRQGSPPRGRRRQFRRSAHWMMITMLTQATIQTRTMCPHVAC